LAQKGRYDLGGPQPLVLCYTATGKTKEIPMPNLHLPAILRLTALGWLQLFCREDADAESYGQATTGYE